MNISGPLVFQITSWHCCDLEYDGSDSDEEDNSSKYLIKIFGVTSDGKSVSLNLLRYTPYFYIKYPFSYNKATCEKFRDFVCSRLPGQLKASFLGVKLFKKKDFYGFHNGELFNFLRFTFKSQQAWKAGIRIFQKAVQVVGLPQCRYKLYESNIEPFLRMMHIKDIEPCGWVRVNKYEINSDILETTCDIDVNAPWTQIERYDCNDMAPMKVVSFDLECISSHGDFPVAKKDYKKVANEVFQYYSKHLDEVEDVASELIKVFVKEESGRFSKVFYKMTPNMTDVERKIKRSQDDIINIIRGRMTLVIVNERKVFQATNGKMSNDEMITSLTERLNTIGLPELFGDEIIQIGTTMHIYGEKQCSQRHILSLGSCDPIDGVEVECCESEVDMLLRWQDLIVNRWKPDVITGYNIFGFDFAYMNDRAEELQIGEEFRKLGKIVGETCPYVEKNLSSSALGDNLLKFVDMNGRVLIDMMKVVQRDHKLDSYKLDNVAHHFMKMNKNDVSPNDIFRLYRGDSADRKIIAEYCVQDCALCNHLMIKLETLANNIGMSNVCYVPLSYIFMRGQSIKIFSLVAKQCREDDFLIPTLAKSYEKTEEEEELEQEGYEGAIVLEPKCSIYLEDPVSVLDYASLYPSSMISENLSHDTLVMDSKYDNLPGVDYLDIRYDIFEGVGDKKVKVGDKVSRFVQFPNNEKGVLPRILMKLLRQRKETRKKIEFVTLTMKDGRIMNGIHKEKDGKIVIYGADGKVIGEVLREDVVEENETYNEFQKAVLDGLQSAYKVTANSLYGQCGAKTSPIYLKDVAASTTATGRKMIMLAQDFILKNYEGSEIVYGDSVTGYTPTMLRVNGKYHIEVFEDIARNYGQNKWIPCTENGRQEKEGCELDKIAVETWTDKGWTRVHRIIRHKLADHKKIIRVLTHTGCVDVTDDHSLFTLDNQKISPKDLQVGMDILHNSFDDFKYSKPTYDTEYQNLNLAKIIGFIFIRGSISDKEMIIDFSKIYIKNYRNCSVKMSILKDYIKLIQNTYPDAKVERNGKVVMVSNSKLVDYVFNEIVLQNGKKQVPSWIHEVPGCLDAFYSGMRDANKYLDENYAKMFVRFNSYNLMPSEDEAKIMGYFMGDGTCGDWINRSTESNMYIWALTSCDRDLLEKYKVICEKVYPFFKWTISNRTHSTTSSLRLYPTLKPTSYWGAIRDFEKLYEHMFYNSHKNKVVPSLILNAPLSIQKAFWDGLYDADGYQTQNGRIGQNSQVSCHGIFMLARMLGMDSNVCDCPSDPNFYIVGAVTKIHRPPYTIKKMYEVEYEGYVYDFTTDNHKFQAGIGDIIASNTDSLFVKFNPKDENGKPITGQAAIPICRELGIKASNEIKKIIKPPHDLEWEKLFWPFILLSKKRYIANKYEYDDNKYKQSSMGVVLKRRDNANIVKMVYGGIIDIILNEKDLKKSLAFLDESLNNLVSGKYPVEELVITKSLKGDYKDPTRIAHKVLADRMKARDPGSAPQVNDRIPYVYVQTVEKKGEKKLQGDKIEHKDYVIKHKLKPDYNFYLTNQIMKPILQVYALVLENLPGYKKGQTHFTELYNKILIDKGGDVTKAKDRWQDLREDEVKKILFDPTLIKLENKKKGNSEITDFFKPIID